MFISPPGLYSVEVLNTNYIWLLILIWVCVDSDKMNTSLYFWTAILVKREENIQQDLCWMISVGYHWPVSPGSIQGFPNFILQTKFSENIYFFSKNAFLGRLFAIIYSIMLHRHYFVHSKMFRGWNHYYLLTV